MVEGSDEPVADDIYFAFEIDIASSWSARNLKIVGLPKEEMSLYVLAK